MYSDREMLRFQSTAVNSQRINRYWHFWFVFCLYIRFVWLDSAWLGFARTIPHRLSCMANMNKPQNLKYFIDGHQYNTNQNLNCLTTAWWLRWFMITKRLYYCHWSESQTPSALALDLRCVDVRCHTMPTNAKESFSFYGQNGNKDGIFSCRCQSFGTFMPFTCKWFPA